MRTWDASFLRYSSYFSERHQLVYVATPKVACTTLKWWFAELEGVAEEIRKSNLSFESDPELIIHDSFHQIAPTITGLLEERLTQILTSDRYFRFALILNPYKRIFSAWQSKLLLREPLQIGPYLDCDFIHHPIEQSEDISFAFEAFLEYLLQHEAPQFKDYHWTPQFDLLRPDLIHYTALSTLEDTTELVQQLSRRIDGLVDPFAGRRMNVSLIPFQDAFITPRSEAIIRKLYAKDFELGNYLLTPPRSATVFSEEQFSVAKKAIELIRGRHRQLDERRRKIVQVEEENGKWRIENREWKIEKGRLQGEVEQLTEENRRWMIEEGKWRIENREWKIEKGRLQGEVEQLTEENRRWKIEEGRWRMENRRLEGEVELLTEENRRWKIENREWRIEKGRLQGEVEQLTEENRRWKIEDEKWRIENREWKIEKGRLKGEVEQLTEENRSWKIENSEWKIENGRLKEELGVLENRIKHREEDLAASKAALQAVYQSRIWRWTKPIRSLGDAGTLFVQALTSVPAIIRNNGGFCSTLQKTLHILKKEGIQNLGYHVRMQRIFISTPAVESAPPPTPPPTPPLKLGEGRSVVVLFLGHDARLAGAQVLLLSLVKWLRQHTSLDVRIILLEGGVLLDQYQEVGPTLCWDAFLQRYTDPTERQQKLETFTGQHIQLIYGNTVVTPTLYEELAFFHAPYLTHVHELEQSIQRYVPKSTIEKMHAYTNAYIACSTPVAENLAKNHSIPWEQLVVIHEFIEEQTIDPKRNKRALRRQLGLNEEGTLVIGCGSFYGRKGGDLFIETAIRLKQLQDVHFYWIGENIWDLDVASTQLTSWKNLEEKIHSNGISDRISFLGVRTYIFDYFQAADIFYLPSREDPFPLVCLEAAQCGLPILCFDQAGGMPEFVEEDAGFVVPFEDVAAVADRIKTLHLQPHLKEKLGNQARTKFLQRHSIEQGALEVLNYCRKIGKIRPALSVIVPNYNCAPFLEKRLQSIFQQSFKDIEVILLDDASTDGSGAIIDRYRSHPQVTFIPNQKNSGNPFMQWKKGVEAAQGAIIWIAEADDFCTPDFLEKLLPAFETPSVALVYSDSRMVDETDQTLGDYEAYYDKLDPHHWKASYRLLGEEEITWGLGVKNTIPNASAVLIRRDTIPHSIWDELTAFRFSGDWFFYTQIVKGNKIAFIAEKLNVHRKHEQTVTSRFNQEKVELLLHEAATIHTRVIQYYPLGASYLPRWEFYVDEQIRAFYHRATPSEFNRYYPYSVIRNQIIEKIEHSKQRRRLLFVTTNDGSANGGSEQLWRKAAVACSQRGDDVQIVIKKWEPEPFFLKEFYKNGIGVIFKEDGHFEQMVNFHPDVAIVSLGDQDEGTDYFELFQQHSIPYVIVNQLTKEPRFWPINPLLNERVKQGYLQAQKVFFTGKNNWKVMEQRLNCALLHGGVVYNPFDVDRTIELPFPSMRKGIHIAMVGNLLRIHKGQHLVIELFQRKKWRERSIHLHIYGKGEDEAVLKRMVEEEQMTNVTFHGHTEDIRSVWEANHAICMPSFMEGLPLALVGAMLCARVPIVTDIGAHREVIEDGVSGFIASEPTVEAMDEALERAYQQRADWEEIGNRARQSILSGVPEKPISYFMDQLDLHLLSCNA